MGRGYIDVAQGSITTEILKMEERVKMVGAKVIASPWRVVGGTEEETGRIIPMKLFENLEETGEPIARLETRSSAPCNYNIHLFISTRFSGW